MPAHSPIPTTVDEAIEGYLIHITRHFSPQTCSAYSQALNLFTKVLHSDLHVRTSQVSIDELQTGWGEHFLNYLQSTRSVETEHLYSRAMIDFFHHAEIHHWTKTTSSDLAAYVLQHRRPKQHNIPTPPTDEIAHILAFVAASPIPSPAAGTSSREYLRLYRDKAFLLTLGETGLKVSEICGLRRRHYHPTANTIKPDEGPALPLTEATNHALSSYLTARAQLDAAYTIQPLEAMPLFARHDKRAGKRILPLSRWTASNIVEEWVRHALPAETRKKLEDNGQLITPQTFRHHFVLTTLAQTGDLATTQALARHTDPSTTRRYRRTLSLKTQEPSQDN